ncbi:ribosomal protein L43, mitochondrial, putative [Plasmodium knowlesi strain H]|uniref:Large ribosomal subunit protein mL43 n=1 Tax=Plasmodium knowlesi (strain H) TaxID=5851 RepID=A0A193R5J3_PLAKH|nr:ribosomal protein L43, mitochondrial, putative [Plasmodium knowlesi strain H]SBO29455.1 ribosomal protein L43, mitochondrial, putative [Plasmodium knowlesi strain H]
MCSNGVYQLKRILLRYSETGHSSRNVRFFLRFILPDYRDENKHLNFEIQHEQYEEPKATFEYINNSRYEVSLKDVKSKHIVDVINLYKDSAGNSDYLKHGGPKVYSNKRSIQVYAVLPTGREACSMSTYEYMRGKSAFVRRQSPSVRGLHRTFNHAFPFYFLVSAPNSQGLWCPSIYSELNAIAYLKKKKKNNIKLPKYTRESLNLNHEVIKGNGRWGNENLFPKGFDQRYLKNIFCYPFENNALKTSEQGEGGNTTEAHMNSFYKFYKN